MSIFFTDLDNTLIYSHNREIGKTKVVVEYLNGREQSFMTELAYNFLSYADWLKVVPVTARTEQQYRRIECSERLHFRYAIVCNGGKLLVDGKEDLEWSCRTDAIAKDGYDSLNKATDLLSHLCGSKHTHRPEKYMSYVKCGDPKEIYKKLVSLVDLNKINVQRDGRKVYLFVNGITKGSAVERFTKTKKYEKILAAGDSSLDISMLNMADIVFANSAIYDRVMCKNKMKIEDMPFSDGICKCIFEMRMRGVL